MTRNKRLRQDTTSRVIRTKSATYEADGWSFREAADSYARERGWSTAWIDPRLLDRIGDIPISRVDQHLLDTVATELKPKARPATKNRTIYTPVSAVLKYSAQHGWCNLFRLTRPRAEKPKTELPTDAELYTFLHACRRAKRILIFLLRTDATLAEALKLTWTDIDFANKTARCVRADGLARTIDLGNKVLKTLALARMLAQASVGRVFLTHQGKPYRQKKCGGGQLKTVLANAARETGIKINIRTLKKIRKARLLGVRPDIDESDDSQKFEAISQIVNSAPMKYQGVESMASRNIEVNLDG